MEELPAQSPRMPLARVAVDAAEATPGVAGTNAGRRGHLVTGDRSVIVPGVVVTAEAGGRYSVDLYLTAELVPLEPLGAQVAARLRQAADAGGLGSALGDVRVSVLDVRAPGVGALT